MTTVSHEQLGAGKRRLQSVRSLPSEVWPSLAISVVWLAVLFDALFGPNIEVSNGAGTNTSSTPSAVVVALFAFLTSWVIARYAFPRHRAHRDG